MRRTAVLTAAVAALTLAGIAPATAATPEGTTWTADLASGEAAGISVEGATARLDPTSAFETPADDPGLTEGVADPTYVVPTGLLTLAPHQLDTPTSQVESTLDADVPEGSDATVDVRGKTPTGGWTEWVPADAEGTVDLPVRTTEVQGRLALTGEDATVRGVTLTATPSPGGGVESLTEAAAFSANVFATREGLVGGTTANGHVITDRDHFVALPSRRALSPRDTSDYSVRVCAPNGRCAYAPVWDVGPWNTRDDYWNPGDQRQEWKDLPQGVPQAQAAFRDGYNGGNDQFGRKLVNPAGIDLGDGVFWDALGLKDNSQVQVDYLWTGSVRLSTVESDSDDGVAEVRSAPDTEAEVVGVAANSADVPVLCRTGSWLQIGDSQFLSAAVVRDLDGVPTCDTPSAASSDTASGTTASDTTASDTTASDIAASDVAASSASGPATSASATSGSATSASATSGSATSGSTASASATSASSVTSATPASTTAADPGDAATPTDSSAIPDDTSDQASTGSTQAPTSAEIGNAAAVRAGAHTDTP